MGFFDKLKAGLSKTKQAIAEQVNHVLKAFVKVDEQLFEDLEEALIMADLGIDTATYIIDQLRDRVKEKRIEDGEGVKRELKEIIKEILTKASSRINLDTKPSIILVIGVNGVGKTTSIGKLAAKFKRDGKTVILAAADTFRAAAIDQLRIWSQRAGVNFVSKSEGSDPASVVYDAIVTAKSENADILICDTAGRLHNKKNLMDELGKINRIINNNLPDSSREVILVLDATTGQNALLQAKAFAEVTHVTGLALTKLDGTAKGGVIISICHKMDIGVKFIGCGEGIDDLDEFNAEDFANAILAD